MKIIRQGALIQSRPVWLLDPGFREIGAGGAVARLPGQRSMAGQRSTEIGDLYAESVSGPERRAAVVLAADRVMPTMAQFTTGKPYCSAAQAFWFLREGRPATRKKPTGTPHGALERSSDLTAAKPRGAAGGFDSLDANYGQRKSDAPVELLGSPLRRSGRGNNDAFSLAVHDLAREDNSGLERC